MFRVEYLHKEEEDAELKERLQEEWQRIFDDEENEEKKVTADSDDDDLDGTNAAARLEDDDGVINLISDSENYEQEDNLGRNVMPMSERIFNITNV